MATNFEEPLAAEIAETCERLQAIREELRRMPGYRALSSWHMERVAEKHRLMARLDTLRRLASLS